MNSSCYLLIKLTIKIVVSKKIHRVHVIFFVKYWSFTDEELDFIINYDIKYRMGLG